MMKNLWLIICAASILTACGQNESTTEHYAVQKKKQIEADLKHSMNISNEKRASMDEL